MQVVLAGFNIDKSLIDKYIKRDVATPEVISAAYARISRSSKNVCDLRKQALGELAKARVSNDNIIFEMGHSSIAEHAVYNIDLIGVSRFVTELIQRSRLASFTEKSQRYVTFEQDYIIPTELEADLKTKYIRLMNELFAEYKTSLNELIANNTDSNLNKRDLENMAKEDARYILPLSTKTQMGITINARSLEALLRRLSSSPYSEAHELYDKILLLVKDVSPSIIKYTAADPFYQKKLSIKCDESVDTEQIRIITAPDHADDSILASLLFSEANSSFHDLMEMVKKLSAEEKAQLWDSIFEGLKPWHKLPRAFEMVDFSIELRMSESSWSQFKRHRQCTILKQNSISTGSYIIPEAIKKSQRKAHWESLLSECDRFSHLIAKTNPELVPYLRSNAHPVRVLIKMNLRELYHFVRLRSDIHAQWEIRSLSQALAPMIQKHCPYAAKFLKGKSEMDAKFESD